MTLHNTFFGLSNRVKLHLNCLWPGWLTSSTKPDGSASQAEPSTPIPPPLSARAVCPHALLDLAMLLRVHWQEGAPILTPTACAMVDTALDRVFPLHSAEALGCACAYGQLPGADESAPSAACPCDALALYASDRLDAELARIAHFEGRPDFAHTPPSTVAEARARVLKAQDDFASATLAGPRAEAPGGVA